MTAIENAMPVDDLAAELEELWVEYLPLTLRRIAVIRDAAGTHGSVGADMETVRLTAHALVGALGLYGLSDAASIARTVEHHVAAGRRDADLLASAADDLEALVRRPLTLSPT